MTRKLKTHYKTDAMHPRFTLIELLVVVAIIAILAAMLLPALNKAKEQARTISCSSKLKSIGTAQLQYVDMYNEYFPPKDADNYMRRTCLLAEIMGQKQMITWDKSGQWAPVSNMTPKKGAAFMCPSDSWHIRVTTKNKMIRSYAFNYHISPIVDPSENIKNFARKLKHVRKPSVVVNVGDGMARNKSTLEFLISDRSALLGTAYPFQMEPGHNGAPHFRHNNLCVFGFVDSHVETRKFSDAVGIGSKWTNPLQ